MEFFHIIWVYSSLQRLLGVLDLGLGVTPMVAG